MAIAKHEFQEPAAPSGNLISRDDEVLQRLGLRRELRKEYTRFSTISFAMGIMGCAATIASTVNTPILLGGPATTVWAWLLGSIGCLSIAYSVAELVSAYPTAGGIYTSTAFVIPSKYRASVTFVTGWMTVMGQLASTSSVNFALSQMIFAAVTIGSDGAYVASTGQVLGLYIGICVLLGLLNTMPTAYLHKMSTIYVFVNMIAIFAVIIGIPAAGRGGLAPSSFVWGSVNCLALGTVIENQTPALLIQIIDQSGWNNRGFVFLLGLLSVQWVMTDYDATAHIAEEVKNAAASTPVAIVVGATSTAILGFFVNVSLCYGIRDITALPGPSGLVFSQILWDNLGKAGGLFVWALIIIVQAMVGATCQLAAVRTIYAVSRDNAFPDKKLLAKIWKVTQTPANAVLLVVVVQTLFGLLYLASFVAINAVFSIAAVALDLSYMIPVVAKVCIHWQKDVDVEFRPGPFYMGKFGYAVNVYAVVWTVLETGILIMPQVAPVDATTMNYAGPIMGAVCGFSWLWYKLYWHKHYFGPGEHILSPEKGVNGREEDSFEGCEKQGTGGMA